MAIFISYSHADKAFVDRLAVQLVRARAPIWLDRWELSVGDSLLQRIQDAIQGAGALLVILSRASVDSEWCKKELTAGLVRELDEKKVLMLPVLIEDCEIPLFLRDKVFADFRSGYDAGLKQLLKALARYLNDTRGRVPGPDTNVDWAIDWAVTDESILVVLTLLQHTRTLSYSILVQVEIEGNERLRHRFVRYAESGLDWLYRQVLVEMLRDAATVNDLRLLLADPQPVTRTFGISDDRSKIKAKVTLTGRILGEDTGSDVLLDTAHQFEATLQSMRANTRLPTDQELAVAAQLVSELGGG